MNLQLRFTSPASFRTGLGNRLEASHKVTLRCRRPHALGCEPRFIRKINGMQRFSLLVSQVQFC